MRRFSLVLFIGIKAAFVVSLESCVYEPPKCNPSTTVQLEDGTSVDLVLKWVPFPRTNKYTANFCKGPAPNGFYTCRRPDPASASYQGKEYGYPTPVTEQTFDNARQTCTGFGPASSSDSGLIELTDEQEKAYIIDYVSRSSIPADSSLWIGCPKYLSGDPEHGFYCYNSNYRYSSNHNIDIGYWDWDNGEPQKQGRRCMVLNLATQKYRAEYCDVAAAVALCEWSPPSQ